MTDKNLKNDTNLTTNHQSDEATADKALFISEWKVDAGEKLYFPTQGREGTIVIDWGDGSSDTISSGDDEYISHKYSEDGIYTIKVDGMITKWSCDLGIDEKNDENSRKLIKILSYGKTSFGPYTFKDACNLVGLPENESPRFFENKMTGVFYRASKFNQSINHWDTSNVTNMSEMFYGASSFNQPLNDWDTSNVTNMSEMFNEASSFNQPLNDWDTSNVTNMSRMFHCILRSSFNQPLNDWDTSNVTNMSRMFQGAKKFNQSLNQWNTSNVTNMSWMFYRAKAFNQPLNDWNTSNVTNMSHMFSNASSFNQPLDKWDVSNVEYMSDIFTDSGLDEDNYSLLLNGPFSERWAELLDE